MGTAFGGRRSGTRHTKHAADQSNIASDEGALDTLLVQMPQEHQVLASVTSNMTSGFVLLDCQKRITYANARVEDLLGLETGALLDRPAFEFRKQLLSLAVDPHLAEEELGRVWANEEEVAADLALAHAAVRWLRVRSFPVRDEPGDLLGWGMLLDDVTLERASEKVKSEALALAAHELKTPLAVIKGSATTLLANSQRWDPASQREMLQLIDEQCDQLHELVNGLLDVWRLDAGLLPINPTLLRLPEVLEPLVARWQERAPRHHISLTLPADLPPLMADRSRLEQVLNHVLDNAVKYAPGGEITIEATAADGKIEITVADQGRGLTQDHLERIFDRFYRVLDAGEHIPGSGMGLAVAKAVVQAHGGSIWATSPGPGKGAVFHVALPLTSRRSPAVSGPVRSPSGPLAAPAEHVRSSRPGDQPTILMVDSDPGMVRYMRANFEAQQYRVFSAADGAQAFQLLEREEPDLVIVDVGMHGMDGFDLLGRIREFSAVPVIMLSARREEGECVRALDLGAADYLGKPFGMAELLARVRVALRPHGQALPRDAQSTTFTSGDLIIDFAQRQVRVAGRDVQLSRTEYKLLTVLAQHVGMVLTHELLLEKVWGPGYNREMDFIWVYIRRVRRKIEPDPSQPQYILTVPGVGYKLARPGQ
ncbi:MAG TPA: ATP-binding protein [Ktedonobacterales bacterium]|nr:ATP-binding protein [Ktedonobacterales bacterium]